MCHGNATHTLHACAAGCWMCAAARTARHPPSSLSTSTTLISRCGTCLIEATTADRHRSSCGCRRSASSAAAAPCWAVGAHQEVMVSAEIRTWHTFRCVCAGCGAVSWACMLHDAYRHACSCTATHSHACTRFSVQCQQVAPAPRVMCNMC